MPPYSLLPQMYDELRKLAAGKLASEKPGDTLNATALVHEARLKLANASVEWQDRTHFFRTAATAIRRILTGPEPSSQSNAMAECRWNCRTLPPR